MVSVITPSICFVFLSLLEFGHTGKNKDKIILHVPFQIIHHHHAPEYIPIPIKKTQKKPEIVKHENTQKKPEIVKYENTQKNPEIIKYESTQKKPEIIKYESTQKKPEIIKYENTQKKPEMVKHKEEPKPSYEVTEPIKHEASTQNDQKEWRQPKQKQLKFKRKPKILTSTPIPLESFLGIDHIFKETKFTTEPIPLRKKNKFNKGTQQLNDYQFSDGTNYYDTKIQQHEPQVTSYMFTSMDHTEPLPRHIPKATGRSEETFNDESDYEHVGYIVFGDRIHQ